MRTLILSTLLAVGAFVPSSVEATTQCSGNENYVSCTHTEWSNGTFVTCTAYGHPDYLTWNCNSY